MSWVGQYHYIFVHFPIALIIMAGIAELILNRGKNAGLNTTVNFLLISAAIFIIPTVVTGLSLEETGIVSKANEPLFEWHETFAFITLALVFAALVFRYWLGRNIYYFITLFLLIISVIITAHFGGEMAFGPINYLPHF